MSGPLTGIGAEQSLTTGTSLVDSYVTVATFGGPIRYPHRHFRLIDPHSPHLVRLLHNPRRRGGAVLEEEDLSCFRPLLSQPLPRAGLPVF